MMFTAIFIIIIFSLTPEIRKENVDSKLANGKHFTTIFDRSGINDSF